MKKAIILAGGSGTRLYPITLETPKPLLTVKRKPIINYLIDLFGAHGVDEIKVVIRSEDRNEFDWWLKRYDKTFEGKQISCAEEKEPMGTIGYWVHYLHKWTGDEPFFLSNGDELKEVDLTAMAASHKANNALATIVLVPVPNPSEYGVARLKGEKIVEFLEKPKDPPGNLISGGLYFINPKVIDYFNEQIRADKKFLMIEKDLFPKLVRDQKLIAYLNHGRWYDCGNLTRWEKAIKEW